MFGVILVGLVLAVCESRNLLLKEEGIHHRREDYIVQSEDFDKTAAHKLVFAIRQQHMDQLTEVLWEVSDPSSERYGQHLTRDEVAAMTANPAAEEAVLRYLRQVASVNPESISRSPYGEYITAEAPVHVWEQEFGTTFHRFLHASSGAAVVRTPFYSLPAEIHEHVSTVFNTVQLPPRRVHFSSYGAPVAATKTITGSEAELSRRRALSADTITPAVLRDYYSVPDGVEGSDAATQSCFESQQDFSPEDLSKFQSLNNLPPYSIFRAYGGHTDNALCYDADTSAALAACGQANLNVQYAMGVSPGSPTTFWYQYSYVQDVFAEWIHDVVSLAAPPLVHSVSHGVDEMEVDPSVNTEFNNMAIKLGAMGVTILAQAGDNGSNSQFGRCGFYPLFPATSAYVTAVGATQGPESASPEIACQSNKGGVATSGGGFSTLNAQPSYQDAAVAAWRDTCNNETDCFPVETGNSFGQYVAYGGRAYPDLSLAGHNYQIVVGGQEYLVSGTAASTPAVAGLVSLVNAQRLAEGLSPVGLINPSIYASAAAFNDITVGKSECMGDLSGGSCCSSGFNATAGWDPVTGLGSVNFTAFKDIFPASRRRVRHLRNVAGSVSDGGNSSGRGSGSAGWTAAALLQSAWTGAVVAVSYVWNLL